MCGFKLNQYYWLAIECESEFKNDQLLGSTNYCDRCEFDVKFQ